MISPNVRPLLKVEDLPPCPAPVLTFTPWGAALLLTDWTSPTPGAFLVALEVLPEVRRVLDLRPAFPFAALEEAPTSEPAVSEVDSRFICEKWEPVPWYAPTAYGRDLFGRSVIPALPPLRRTVRSGKGGKA